MAMVDVDGRCHFSADSQPKSIGLVQGLAATRRSVYIHQMNQVNSRYDSGHGDSVVVLIFVTVFVLVHGNDKFDNNDNDVVLIRYGHALQ